MKRRIFVALLALSLASGPSFAAAAPPAASPEAPATRLAPSARNLKPTTTIPLAPTPFRGYPEAYVLHNDRVHAVVVPAISRLVFLAPSADAPNLLRLDPALADALGESGRAFTLAEYSPEAVRRRFLETLAR